MKYVFLFGQFLIGMGSTPLSVLGVTFIDESVDPQVYPIYIGKFAFLLTACFSFAVVLQNS